MLQLHNKFQYLVSVLLDNITVELKHDDAQSKHIRLLITLFSFDLFWAHVEASPSHTACRVAIS